MPSKMGSNQTTEGGPSGSAASNEVPTSAPTEDGTVTINDRSSRQTDSPPGMANRNDEADAPSTEVDETDSTVNQPLRSNDIHPAVPTSNQFSALSEDVSSEEPSSTQNAPRPLQSQPCQPRAQRNSPASQRVGSRSRTFSNRGNGETATSSVTPPYLSYESRHFLETFNLRLACWNCYRHQPRGRHSCQGDLLLCYLQRNKVWGVIRQRTNPYYQGFYKMCKSIETTNHCLKRELCSYCHSEEEQNIWNAERGGRFARREICRYLRHSQNLPHNLPRQLPQPSTNEGFQIVRNKKRKCSESASVDSQDAPQSNDSQTRNKKQTVSQFAERKRSAIITDKDRKAYRDLMSKVGGRFLNLCEKCFDSSPPVMSERSAEGKHCNGEEKHPWSEVMVHALITKGEQQYLKIRTGSHRGARLCRHIVKRFGCWLGDSCSYAHNEVEIDVWKCPVRQDVIVKLGAPAFAHRIQYAEEDQAHESSRQVVLYSERTKVWRIAQGRHPSLKRQTLPVLCRKRDRCDNDSCTHPHFPEEVELWTYMGKHNLGTLEEVMSITSKIQPYCCSYCSQHFEQMVELKQHLQTVGHRARVDSDREKDWKHRKPPWNVEDGNYRLCEVVEGGTCLFSSTTPENNSCTKAHSREELDEWKERHQYRMAKIKTARDRKLHSYMGDLLAMHEAGMDVFEDRLPDVDVDCSEELNKHLEIDSTPGSRVHTFRWEFSIKSKYEKPLKEVGLLFPDPHVSFYLSKNAMDHDKLQVCPGSLLADDGSSGRYRVQVVFTTQMLGTFSQSVVFNFGGEPVLYRRLQVDVGAGDLQIPDVPDRVVLEPWNSSNSHIVKFTDAAGTATISQAEQELMDRLLKQYPPPTLQNRRHDSSISETLTRDNYRQVMHRVLYIEEKECNKKIYRFATSSILKVSSNLHLPDGMHCALEGHMFASIDLQQALMDDSTTSQIISKSVQNILLKFGSSNKVYEAAILPNQTFGRGSQTTVHVKLSRQCVRDQGLLTDGSEKDVTVQLQLDRTQFCFMHFAVDQLQNMDMVLPDPNKPQRLPDHCRPWTNEGANPKQEEIVDFISNSGGPEAPPMPGVGPVLVCGPFGTGKTFTLATAVKETLDKRPQCKVLICTHSNSAADWYITSYLHSFVQATGGKMIRVYATYRNIGSIEKDVRPYLLKDEAGNIRLPVEEDVRTSQIVVTTLTTAVHLVKEDLRGCFSHILIDEAGQVLEAEALMPLTMATKDTCVVLAGDHIQMCPKIFSEKIRDAGFNKSLLERLCLAKACSIFLTANYRTCQLILDFIAKTYYNQTFRAQVVQPLHAKFHPLMFSLVKGTDQPAGKSYVNTHEVLEVVRRVKELKQDWPREWESFTDANSIGVITPCIMQARVSRDSLRKEGLGHVTVETVDNVQGKQFRVVIITTVRTRKTLKKPSSGAGVSVEKEEFFSSFFSDPKVLNTAFTRTKSLLLVVGDAAALCSLGSCSTKWMKYLKVCEDNNSLFPLGSNLAGIRAEVREARQTLNPNAVPFLPANHRKINQTSAKNQDQQQVMDSALEGTSAPPQQVPDDLESNSDVDSLCTDDDDSEIEDYMLAELQREVEEDEEKRREVAAQTERANDGVAEPESIAKIHMPRAQDGAAEPESIAKIHLPRAQDVAAEPESIAKIHMPRAQDVSAEPESIAKVHMPRAQDVAAEPESIAKVPMPRKQGVGAEPESIAKVHMPRAQDGEADQESIAKVHMPRAQDGVAGPESIAKVHMPREQDGTAEPESIAKVHMPWAQDGVAGPESIAKIHTHGAQDGEAAAESVAKVHMPRAQDGTAEPESIAKVHMPRAQDGVAGQMSVAKVNTHTTQESKYLPTTENPNPHQPKGHWSGPKTSSFKMVVQQTASGEEPTNKEMLSDINMRPGGKSSRRSKSKFRMKHADHLVDLFFVDTRDHSHLEGASDFDDDVADETEQEEYFKMMDKEMQREGLRHVESEPDKYKICSFRFESTITFAIPKGENSSHEICISGRKNRGQALNLDEVVVEILENDDRYDHDASAEKKTYGKVICILKRTTNPKRKKIVCTLDKYTDNLMVPKDRTFPKMYVISGKGVKRVHKEHGVSADYVPISIFKKRRQNNGFGFERMVKVPRKERQSKLFCVKFLKWDEKNRYPVGYVTEELPVGDNQEDGLLILKHTHGIRDDYPPSIIRDLVSKCPKGWQIPKEELKSRKDYRSKSVFTVDHPETQDLDDALSIEEKDGGYEVGIHIADVSHFVQKDSTLDQEARDRAVSFYPSFSEPVGMLPPHLSTNLCSLLPDKDRLAISVIVTMHKDASITDVKYELSVIKSKKRLSLEEAEQMIMAQGYGREGSIEQQVWQLSQLAQKRRQVRMSDSCHAYSHSKEGELCHPLASSMVEEMMLIANEEVSKFLLGQYPKLTPLRSQLPPDNEKVEAWLDSHREDIPNSFCLQCHPTLDGEGRDTRSHQDVFILKNTGEKLMRIMNSPEEPSGKMSKITDIMCSDENHPQLAVALTDLHHIQEKATYSNSSEYKDTQKMKHHSLKKPSYTHFTSPIRRYFDVVVQRLLKAASQNTGDEPYSAEELSLICHHCTNQGIRAKRFEKESASFHFALKLKQTPELLQAYVGAIGESGLQLMYPYRSFVPRATQNVPLQHLNPVKKPELEDSMKVNLTWKLRIYDVSRPPIPHIRGQSILCTEQFVMKISATDRQMLLQRIKINDLDSIRHIFARVYESHKQLEEDRRVRQLVGETSQPVTEISQTLDSDGSPSPFAEFSRGFQQSDVLQVQLHASLVKGVIEPSVQLVSLTPTFGLCTEHRMKPVESFDVVATKRAVRCNSIQKYKEIWLPIVEVMSVHNAVHSNESLFIRGVKIYWDNGQSPGTWCGRINLPSSFCEEWHIRFSPPNTSDDKDELDESDEEEVSKDPDMNLDYLCIRYTDLPISDETKRAVRELECKSRGMQSQKSTGIPERMPFTVHATVTDLRRYKGNREVHFAVKKLSSPFPRILLESAERFACTVEVIPKQEQDRRLENAVRDLDTATPLTQNICLLKKQPIDMGTVGDDLRSSMAMDTPFGQLNKSQHIAVSRALQQQFTAIQGPPGTGKTIVGATLASLFAEINMQSPPSGKTPQVLYCGPSNESVNVVGGYLKILNSKVARVYSETIERLAYPIPGDPATISQNRTSQENKVDHRLDDIALHHLIRKKSNGHSERIREFDRVFSDSNHKASAEEIRNYRQEIAKAEKEELRKYHVILCTCNAAGSRRIKDNVKAVQCIIDEAGMCSKPETLIPLTATNPEKIVLIGDHKQLRPIITASLAEELGMKISMLEEYEKHAIMLTTQYRMHETICKFPSDTFYKSKLETAEVVKRRRPEPKAVQRIWPAEGKDFRNVFCHVDGREETQSVKSADANENSRANPQEVKHVVQIVLNLITKCKIKPERILVLSQYRLQCTRIRDRIEELGRHDLKKVTVSTVITSQGGERDYVVFSTVRSLPRQEIEEKPTLGWKSRNLGFIMDDNQINVALTRARKGLIIVGNQRLLQVHDTFKKLLDHYRHKGAVLNAETFVRRFRQVHSS
ncbi:uncharacterized protein LOC119742480 isoform X2 [Patiria miniata]|uniref:Helicase with zinc finger domain 2 n=1 Tax=Patiria miniata TaxID=46514 RepID=A0A914BEP8_PATMI|nr:uncharacterized protein LOC119742480 isoform X2 [Patiria miniata]